MEKDYVLSKSEEKESEALNNNVAEKDKSTNNDTNHISKEDPEDKTTNNDITKEDPNTSLNKKNKPEKSFTNIFFLVCIVGVSLGILLEIVHGVNRGQTSKYPDRPKYWVFSKKMEEVNNKDGVLQHVHKVLQRLGYEKKSTNETPWNLLWSYSYPFKSLNLQNLSANQKVNHVPGTAFITSKPDLATSKSKYIPKAFKLPKDKEELLLFAAENKNALFVEKSNTHRNVHIKNVSDIDMTSGNVFVQEYIQNPFLVDGYKFDIGVYVVLTSVDPLRVYWYKGDILFRYCMEKYYPFDPKKLNKYVVGSDYLPTWQVPSLKHSYTVLGNTMKEAFDIYVRSKGKDPTDMWKNLQMSIAEVFLMKHELIMNSMKNYASHENFFEMMRFDYIVDENLNVYLMEANMGPNLSSKHYPPNQLLYEQVLYNLFSLTGVTKARISPVDGNAEAAENMVTAQKNTAVYGEECRRTCWETCDASDVCGLCKPCISAKINQSLYTAHTETLHKGDFRRLIPPPMTPNKDLQSAMEEVKNLSENNKLLHLWYQGKCNQDITWCT